MLQTEKTLSNHIKWAVVLTLVSYSTVMSVLINNNSSPNPQPNAFPGLNPQLSWMQRFHSNKVGFCKGADTCTGFQTFCWTRIEGETRSEPQSCSYLHVCSGACVSCKSLTFASDKTNHRSPQKKVQKPVNHLYCISMLWQICPLWNSK